VTGTEQSFEEAFDELFPRAFRLARRLLGDVAAAEDVAAEALARAYARWSRVGSLPWRDGWVLRVASNLAIDVLRRQSAAPEPPLPVFARAEDEVVALRLALAAALPHLPKRQRQAVTLRYLAGLTDVEVAEALGISAGSVKTHVHRGLAALRGRLGPGFEEVVPVGLD
jgi:RNA polymerase sigma-70 factor (sigma-E family)